MLFHSFEFLFVFLPVALIGCFVVSRLMGYRGGLVWLAAMALIFYGMWNPRDVLVLTGSIAVNFVIAHLISRTIGGRRNGFLIVGVIFNLSLLGYFKYWSFFAENISRLPNVSLSAEAVVLPLAISFFTFTQIAYLVDLHRDGSKPYGFLEYANFVLFFPHLIAGPIIYHASTIPQFRAPRAFTFQSANVAIGMSIFVIGLTKKVMIADSMASYATPVFASALQGGSPDLLSAWGAALAYTYQLYFDFSGYSDMAIGLAFMLGIRLPVNFFSPYKATSVVDFWRRWHISLSRFVRDYLYIPLGGNRGGGVRQSANVMATMLLMGLWHGAGWTFVIWGGLHGAYIAINHGWRSWRKRLGSRGMSMFPARLLTFLAVVIGWVLFRAESLDAATAIYAGMIGWNGIVLPQAIAGSNGLTLALAGWLGAELVDHGGLIFVWQWVSIALLMLWTNAAPNTMEIFGSYRPFLTNAMGSGPVDAGALPVGNSAVMVQWTPSALWLGFVSLLTIAVVWHLLVGTGPREFIYFQF